MKEIEIGASIDKVWGLLNGSLEQMQKIMPQVVENTPIKITEEVVGSIYKQKYKEGKRIEEYEVHTLEFVDQANYKKLKVGFTLARMFEITALYELHAVDDHKMLFKYTVTNRALKWFVKLILLFANEKIVVNFVEKVKSIAESEA